MRSAWITALPPPAVPPPNGYAYYLPEDFYFFEDVDRPLTYYALTTVRTIAAWSRRVRMRSLNTADDWRERVLSNDVDVRRQEIDELFESLNSQSGGAGFYAMGIELYDDGVPLLRQGDGIPGVLTLTPEQFESVRESWKDHEIPEDLYYPAQQQREEIESIQLPGGVVLALRRYSPIRWAQRETLARERIPIPSEEERIARLNAACGKFIEALDVRLHELKEPGRQVDEEEFSEATLLMGKVLAFRRRVRAASRADG